MDSIPDTDLAGESIAGLMAGAGITGQANMCIYILVGNRRFIGPYVGILVPEQAR